MSTPFIGQISFFSWPWAPEGWLLCDGAEYPIQRFGMLHSLIGNFYGGDGITKFKVPDLRGRVPVGVGKAVGSAYSWTPGGKAGDASVALDSQSYLPPHNHVLTYWGGQGLTGQTGVATAGALLGPVEPLQLFAVPKAEANTTLSFNTLGPAYGKGDPHENRQPYLALTACIACEGDYPSFSD